MQNKMFLFTLATYIFCTIEGVCVTGALSEIKQYSTYLQVIYACKFFAASEALERSLSSVHTHVFLQCFGLRVSFTADVTSIWLFPSMRAHVLFEVVSPRKRLAAHCTLIWFLPSMNAHV